MRRTLRFRCYDDVVNDAETLLAKGYERGGQWSLAQVCTHLSKTIERTMEGFPERKPWWFRTAARTLVLGSLLKHKQFNRRFPAPGYLSPGDPGEDKAGVERLRTAVTKLKAFPGELAFHPVFGKLTPSQWFEYQLWHCEHHLSFLHPKLAPAPA